MYELLIGSYPVYKYYRCNRNTYKYAHECGVDLLCSGCFMRALGYIPLGKYRNARTAHRSSVLPTFSEERLGIILYLVRRLPGGGLGF